MDHYYKHYQLKDSEGNVIPFKLPYCWEGVTFRQMEKLWEIDTFEKLADTLTLFEIFTGIPRETWAKANDIEMYIVANGDLMFLADRSSLDEIKGKVDNKVVYNGRKYELPKDLAMKSIGQYEDMKRFCIQPILDTTDAIKQASYIPMMAAIYLQPLMGTTICDYHRGKIKPYSYSQAKELAEQLKDCSIMDLIPLNNFFFRRLNASKENFTGLKGWILRKLKRTRD